MGIADAAGNVIMGGLRNTPIGRGIQIIAHTGGLSGQGDKEIEELGALDSVETAIGGGKEDKVTDATKAKALQKIKDMIEAELAKSCKSNNKECKGGKHRGKIHSQDGGDDIVSAEEAGTNWINLPNPPSLTLCKAFALAMRTHMLGIKGHGAKKGKGIDFEKGATQAYNKMISWMEEKTPYGVSVEKYSFNFDGIFYMGGKPPKNKNSTESRRIDLDVFQGEILKSK